MTSKVSEKNWIFTPCRSETPENFITKIGHFDYVVRCYTHAKFYGNRPRGACWNITSFDFEYLSFPFLSFHFTARCYAERGIGTASRLSVTLRYHDHTGWNTSKIISPLVTFGCSLFADPSIMDLLQGEHPEILAGIGEGYRKSGFQRAKALISLKLGKIRPRLLLRSNRKSHTRFRLVRKSMTSDQGQTSLLKESQTHGMVCQPIA